MRWDRAVPSPRVFPEIVTGTGVAGTLTATIGALGVDLTEGLVTVGGVSVVGTVAAVAEITTGAGVGAGVDTGAGTTGAGTVLADMAVGTAGCTSATGTAGGEILAATIMPGDAVLSLKLRHNNKPTINASKAAMTINKILLALCFSAPGCCPWSVGRAPNCRSDSAFFNASRI